MKNYYVNTIYPAFMGEVNTHGIGCPCTFVRLSGCNLRCYYKTKGYYCDTPEALTPKCGKLMSNIQIGVACHDLGNEVVCLTGGEPLIHDTKELIEELVDRGHKVVVETNGSVDISPFINIKNVSFVVDCKSPSSGYADKMMDTNYSFLGKDDFVKFVIDTEKDYQHFVEWINNHKYLKCHVAVGTFWGSKIGYQELIMCLREDKITNVYLNMQAHKMMCLYDSMEYYNLNAIKIPKNL